MKQARFGWLLLACCGAVCTAGLGWTQTPLQDQQYRLGIGDILQLNVLQQPELDGPLTIRPDGTAIIARVGSVPLRGLTMVEAEELVRQRLQLYNPSITDISLTVTEYNALRIYVLGAVTTPGSYTFTTPPSLWDAVRSAGGPTNLANLTAVRLISQQGGLTKTETYDLSSLLMGEGSMPEVRLRSGDTVVIPASDGVLQVAPGTGVQVFGAVGNPSTVPIHAPTRLVTVLMQAGTPLEDGTLNKVWWVHREGADDYRSTRVNLKLFLEEGSLAGNPLVYPGDTVRLPQEKPGWFRDALPIILGVATTTAAVIIAYDRLQE